MLLSERSEPRRSPRERRRTWREPTPPPAPPVFEGGPALDSAVHPSLRLLLWQAGRDVQIWSQATPADRVALFTSPLPELSSELAAEFARLDRPLRVLSRLVTLPGKAAAPEVAVACVDIVEWADLSAFLGAAAWYAELAAGVEPADPTLATLAGRANRRNGEFVRAQHWFEVAVDLARVAGDQASFAEALVSWGNMEYHRARHVAARRLYVRCWRRAKKYNLRELGAAARHNLLALELELGRYSEAAEHAAAAVALFGLDHPRLFYLAHDIAQLWAEEGYYDIALLVFGATLPFFVFPKEQIKVWANIGRAAAGAGDIGTFYEAWEFVSRDEGLAGEHAAEALVSIGQGAHLLGLAAKSYDVARDALKLARDRKDAAAEQQAERLLSQLREGRCPSRRDEPPDSARMLASRLMRALNAQRTAPG